MSLKTLTQPFPWSRYSKKLNGKIERPRSGGLFSKNECEERGMFLAVGQEGAIEEGNLVRFYWMIDPDDGIIVDARFQVYGQSALIGAAEIACELVVGKNYDQARRISAELIDKQVRDRADVPAFPEETSPHLNLVLGAIDNAAETCKGIPLAVNYVAPPAPMDIGEILEGGYPGWEMLTKGQKISLIEEIVARDIRPYIELDAGGIKVLDFLNENEVHIAYQGSCTTCFSATGTTLSYIQQVLRGKVHPSLVVVPDLSTFH
jgi:NifU-like protein